MPETITRRSFIQSSSVLASASLLPRWMPRLAFSPPARGPLGDVLIAVFLRGAADALNMVVPHGDNAYYALRPTLGIPRPDDHRVSESERTIDLDGFFGLHPSLSPLVPAWQAGDLTFIHACGAPDESRSHFKAMALMERGVEDERGPASGWIGRHLATLDTGNPSPLRAVAIGEMPQRSLSGAVPVTALRSIADFHLAGDPRALARMQNALSALYAGDDPLMEVGQETLEILDTLQRMDPLDYRPSTDLPYPESEFGMGMRQIATLIKAEVGLEVAAIDVGGWDTHFAQGASQGQMAELMWDLASGLAAFHSDLRDFTDHLTVVVMSEFGRRACENGSLGTDHGHGSAMFLMGGNVTGGRVHGDWPGLADGQLVGPGDLAVTTDYRDVLGEVCVKRLGNPALSEIFPGFSVNLRGLVR
jgi:uncharacterized protein (DUF1501 family)